MKPDGMREAAKAVREALELLAAEESANSADREKLRAALELARQSLDAPLPDKAPRSCFAPPPLLFRVGVAAFMEGLASLSLNATTKGEAPSYWLAANWQKAF